MANSSNPFYIDPTRGGENIPQLLSGLGDTIGKAGEKRKALEQEQAMQAELQAAFQSGDPLKMAEMSLKYPQLRAQIMGASNVQQGERQKLFKGRMLELVSQETPQARIQVLERQIKDGLDLGLTEKDMAQSIESLSRMKNAETMDDLRSEMNAQNLMFSGLYPEEGRNLFGGSGETADQKSFEALMSAAGIEKGSPEYKKAARVKARIEAPAVGSAAMTVASTPGATEAVAGSKAQIKGAEEEAKLKAQYKLSPQVAKAVTLAQETAKSIADDETVGRSNAKALKVYETAIKSLGDSLGQTMTGPIVGWIPALTSSAQTANGALAMMAPVLKDLFRAAGEGTFTKDDQQILMDMLPTRRDSEAARVAKLKMVDQLVRAKLGASAEGGGMVPDSVEQAPITAPESFSNLWGG